MLSSQASPLSPLTTLAQGVLRFTHVHIPLQHYWLLLRLKHEFESRQRTRDEKTILVPGRQRELAGEKYLQSEETEVTLKQLIEKLCITKDEAVSLIRYVHSVLDVEQRRQNARILQKPEGQSYVESEEQDGHLHSLYKDSAMQILGPSLAQIIVEERDKLYDGEAIRDAVHHLVCGDRISLHLELQNVFLPFWNVLVSVWYQHGEPENLAIALQSIETHVAALITRAHFLRDENNALRSIEKFIHVERLLGPPNVNSNMRLLLTGMWRLFRDVLVRALPAVFRALYEDLKQFNTLPIQPNLSTLTQTRCMAQFELDNFWTDAETIMKAMMIENHKPHIITIRNGLQVLATFCIAQTHQRSTMAVDSDCSTNDSANEFTV